MDLVEQLQSQQFIYIMTSLETLNELIRKRRTVFTEFFSSEELSDDIVENIIENATWAPTHKKTQPWKFLVYKSQAARTALSDMLKNNYRTRTPELDWNEIKENKIKGRPLQAPVAIAIILTKNETAGLPEWEEVAAVSCAVQNMYLTCTAMGLGAFWSTPNLATEEVEFFDLSENEKCLGIFYFGKIKDGTPPFGSSRRSIADVSSWF